MAEECCCWCSGNPQPGPDIYSPFSSGVCNDTTSPCGCLDCQGESGLCDETCLVFGNTCDGGCESVCNTTGGNYLTSYCQEIPPTQGCMEWNCFNYNPNATFQTSCYGCCFDNNGNPDDGCGFTPSPSPGKGPPRKPISMGIAKKGGRVNSNSRFSGRSQNNPKGKAKKRRR